MTWATGLSGLTGEQIANGLHKCCEDKTNEWPTLPWFRAKCLNAGTNEFGLDYVPEYHRQEARITERSRLLSSDERNAKRASLSENIANLKAVLRGAQENSNSAASDCDHDEIAGNGRS